MDYHTKIEFTTFTITKCYFTKYTNNNKKLQYAIKNLYTQRKNDINNKNNSSANKSILEIIQEIQIIIIQTI